MQPPHFLRRGFEGNKAASLEATFEAEIAHSISALELHVLIEKKSMRLHCLQIEKAWQQVL